MQIHEKRSSVFFDSFMETLTLKQKEALQFRREGYTLAEIAKMVSVPTSVSSIQERLDRAYYKMTQMIRCQNFHHRMQKKRKSENGNGSVPQIISEKLDFMGF